MLMKKNLIQDKHRVQRIFRLCPHTYGGQYKVNKAVAKAKINYFSSELNSCSGDENKTWSVIGEVLDRAKNNLYDEIVVDERKITDSKS